MTRRWQVLAVSSVAMFLVFLVLTTLNVAFPDVERSFPESSRAGLSWVLTSYNIVFAALLIPAGRLADRYGRRRFFLAGLLLFVVSSALCAAASSPPPRPSCSGAPGSPLRSAGTGRRRRGPPREAGGQ